MTRKIASHYLSSRKGLIRNALVEVADDGKILSLGTAENIDSLCGVEFYSGILCPGWVNAHCHLELSYLRGAIAEGTGFAGFAREIGRTRGGFTPSQRLAAAEVADAAMRAEGVAAVGDVANDALIMPVKARSAIRYRTFAEAFGLTTDSTDCCCSSLDFIEGTRKVLLHLEVKCYSSFLTTRVKLFSNSS